MIKRVVIPGGAILVIVGIILGLATEFWAWALTAILLGATAILGSVNLTKLAYVCFGGFVISVVIALLFQSNKLRESPLFQ